MASSKEIKARIKSVRNTGKITRAMELISTVKMKKAQERVFALRPFARQANQLLSRLPEGVQISKSSETSSQKVLVIAIGSSKGLCGAYNVSLYRALASLKKQYTSKNLEYISIGKKAREFLSRTSSYLVEDFDISRATPTEQQKVAHRTARVATQAFRSHEYDEVVIVYNHYFSAISQVALTKSLLPMTRESIEAFLARIDPQFSPDDATDTREYEIEPSAEYIIDRIIPFILESMILEIFSEALASEHAARMFAMKNAKDAAGKKVKKLTVSYNNSRQAAITKEVSEIVSGVESLKEV